MCSGPAQDLPQQSLSSENSLAPEMMESKSPPHATDDTEVLSQRTSPGHGEVRRATETTPEGNASADGDMGGIIPMDIDGRGLDQSGPQPNTAPESPTALDPSKQSLLKEGECRLPRQPPSIRRRRIH